jgi:DNA-binding CsgD family transcriptional regulator
MTLRTLSRSQQDALITAFERSRARMSPQRKRRLLEILRRNVFGTESPKRLYTEFRISKQRFFLERSEVLRRLATLVSIPTGHPQPAVVRDEPGKLMLTQARALYAAGNASAAARLLERIDDQVLAPGDRFDALRTIADALDESGTLACRAAHIDERLQRWCEASTGGTPEHDLAIAAGLWLRMRLGHLETASRTRSSLALRATMLVRRAVSSADPEIAFAYGRLLTQSTFVLVDEGDVSLAESQLRNTRELAAGDPHLAAVFAGEWHALHSAVHWFDPASVRLARVERRTAYDIATQAADVRTVWACLYFEIRDQFAQKNFAFALALARELFDSARATGNAEWRRLAQSVLVDAHLLAGHLDDARRLGALASQDSFLQAHLSVNLACKVASMQRDFRTMLELSTAFVEGDGERDRASAKAGALRHQARAAYHIGAVRAAVAAIEDAVTVCESYGWTEPWDLQRTYDDAARITGRRRYRDALADITTTLHAPEQRPESISHRASGLSERQLQTARLAASGLTNDAIGRALGISARTVEKHLDAVFARLAIQSRRQLRAVIAP